jgi:predicted CoA-binding protein
MKTLVFGGSLKPERYSNKAIKSLRQHDVVTVSYGLRAGDVSGIAIDTELVNYEDIHTITLYLNPKRQEPFYDYFLGLNPKRIIFNPGTENKELAILAQKEGIEAVEACTLVMLATGQY